MSDSNFPAAQSLYDVFLSHSSKDKPNVETLARRLQVEEGIESFLDTWHLIPGQAWQPALEEALNRSKTCAVFLGPSGLGAWEHAEMRVALDKLFRSNTFRVIPVLLPGAELQESNALPAFLSQITWVDFSSGLDDAEAFRSLVAGIRGVAPGSGVTGIPPKTRRISNLPFPRNDYFTGRENILTNLHTWFSSGQKVQALSGLGGVGKTQSALEYAYLYEENYQFQFWVKAHTSESLSVDYVSIAALLSLPEKEAQEQSIAIAAVKRWLDSHNDWLLIVDNADDLATVKPFLPLRKTGDVLLTTRAHKSKPIAAMQSIEKMEVREGALFLLSRLGEIEMGGSLESASTELRSQAESITKELDGLPLALDQAAAFIEERPSSLGEYLKLYQTARGELLQRRGSLADHDPVTVTFSLAFGKVAEASPAAADLLRVCAFLEADAIPEEIFAKGAGELGESIGSAMTNPLGLGDAIAEACRYSLLRRDPITETVSLHRLVQVVLKEEMDDTTRRMWAERAMRAVNAAFPSAEFANWQVCSRLVPHVLQLVGTINQYDFAFEESATLLNQTGYYLHERAQYAEAEPLMRRVLAIDEASFGKDHPNVARDLNNLARLLQATNRLAEAEPLMRRVVEIVEKSLGKDHPNVAASLNNLAQLLKATNRLAEAEPLMRRALTVFEASFGKDHPNVAIRLNNLAGLLKATNRLADAEPLYRKALEIDEASFGKDHPDVAIRLNNLAQLLQATNRLADAEPLMRRALAIDEASFGKDHPNVARDLNNLALLLQATNRLAEAEPLMRRVVEIFVKFSAATGHPYPHLQEVLGNYFSLLTEMGCEEAKAIEKVQTLLPREWIE